MRRPAVWAVALFLSTLLPGAVAAQGDLDRARELQAEAQKDWNAGRFREGTPKAREALALREKALGPEHPQVAESLHALAQLLRESGDYAGARPLLERAIAIREQKLGPASPQLAASLSSFGYLLYLTGETAAARPLLERAVRIHEQALGPGHPQLAFSLTNLGLVVWRSGDLAGARVLFERALKIREQTLPPTNRWLAQSLTSLGEVLRDMGDYAAARPLLERALTIRETALGPNHPDYASGLTALGYLLHLTGDNAAARPLLEKALAIRERALGPDHPAVATTLNDVALVLSRTGDYAAARAHFERALKIREQALGLTHTGVAQSLTRLAVLLADAGDYAAARPLLERGLKTYEQAVGPDHHWVAWNANHLARLLHRTGDTAGARALYERALKIREKALGPDHPSVAFSLQTLAYLLRTTGDPAGAGTMYERALTIREKSLGPNHPAVAWTLMGVAYLRRSSGNHAAARALFERALPIARSAGDPDLTWRVTLGLGAIHEGQGRPLEALPLYQEAVKTLEGVAGQFEGEERAQFLQADNRLAAYDALARLLLKLHEQDQSKGYDREAWSVLEAKKGRVVAEALAAARPKLQDPKAREEAQKTQAKQDQLLALEQALREEQEKPAGERQAEKLRSLTKLLAQTKADYLAQVQAFLVKYPKYKSQFVDQQTVDPKVLAKFADRLPAGTLAVQYFAAPDTLYLFLVARGGVFKVKNQAVPQTDLYAMIRQYRQFMDRAVTQRVPWSDDGSEVYRREVAPLKALSAKLAAHLLGPIEAELRTHRNLILIPNDLLLYLPIHALTRAEADGSVRFLAETHAVSYVTQLELVDLLSPSKPTPDAPLLALANPDGSLPGASQEVRALRRIRQAVTALEGAQATKAEFLSQVGKFPDIHLATHGVLDPKRPERSYLLMAGEDERNQQLGVAEIAGLVLLPNAMAILSACETAVGEQVPGAALMTLAAAFSQAGAQSILASLWKVEDRATRDFMVVFHRALPAAGRAGALQQAQRAVLADPATAHPYYWAPFILIGAR